MTPRPVRALTVLLILTAAATVVVEVLNLRYAPEHGLGVAVRTGWAMIRTVGWLVLISPLAGTILCSLLYRMPGRQPLGIDLRPRGRLEADRDACAGRDAEKAAAARVRTVAFPTRLPGPTVADSGGGLWQVFGLATGSGIGRICLSPRLPGLAASVAPIEIGVCCGDRCRLPLRGSPGFSPGSLLPLRTNPEHQRRPQDIVAPASRQSRCWG